MEHRRDERDVGPGLRRHQPIDLEPLVDGHGGTAQDPAQQDEQAADVRRREARDPWGFRLEAERDERTVDGRLQGLPGELGKLGCAGRPRGGDHGPRPFGIGRLATPVDRFTCSVDYDARSRSIEQAALLRSREPVIDRKEGRAAVRVRTKDLQPMVA